MDDALLGESLLERPEWVTSLHLFAGIECTVRIHETFVFAGNTTSYEGQHVRLFAFLVKSFKQGEKLTKKAILKGIGFRFPMLGGFKVNSSGLIRHTNSFHGEVLHRLVVKKRLFVKRNVGDEETMPCNEWMRTEEITAFSVTKRWCQYADEGDVFTVPSRYYVYSREQVFLIVPP